MLEGCDLGIPRERYLWRVHVRADEVLDIPGGGAIEAQGVGYPLEKISCLVPLKDWYVLRTGIIGPFVHTTRSRWAGDDYPTD
jgi:hypothetical protein